MQLGEIFLQVIVALLGAYIALTGALATRVLSGLEHFGLYSGEPPQTSPLTLEERPEPLPSPSSASPNFARILLDNLAYQEAAVFQAIDEDVAGGHTATIEDALVNIVCTYTETGGETYTSTGSGVFIGTKGVILTNAHVVQYLLLSTADATCRIREDSPARDRYRAKLLYLSPLWVSENAKSIMVTNPSRTGEHDYALLFVTEAITGDMPDTFPALDFDTAVQDSEALRELYAAGYPKATSDDESQSTALTSTVSSTTLVRRFTFGSGTTDLIALSESPVGAYGASGGPVTNEDGTMVGLIVTRSNPERDGEKSLRALTLSYIDAAIHAEAGFGLKTMLAGDIAKRADIFKAALAPALAQVLE